MKKQFLLFGAIVATLCILISCNKEELSQKELTTVETNEAPLLKVAPRPDLIIDTYKTDIPNKTTICTDTLLPNTHCNGGVRTFTAFALISNIGAAAVPAGTVEVRWDDFGFGTSFVQVIPHSGIPALGTLLASRPYYVGPCDCTSDGTVGSCFVHSYGATVDPNNLIAETNEGNNDSDIYDTCDGCGPCELGGTDPDGTEGGGL